MILNIEDNGYGDYLRKPSYQEARNERLRIDNYVCQGCGGRLNLEVHHINRDNNDAPDAAKDLVTLCRSCHQRIEDAIKNKQYLAGQFWFTVIGTSIDHFEGSDSMEECDRVKLTLLAYDQRSPLMRYVKDNLPISNNFTWKWKAFMRSIGSNVNKIDTEIIAQDILGCRGMCELVIVEGERGKFNRVQHYIEAIPNELHFDHVPSDSEEIPF